MARTAAATELAPNITLIPAKRRMNTEFDSIGIRKRVAAYCRVSTEEDNQQNSYATQVNYYTELITSHPDWDLVGIFADEGISGTQMTKRAEFKKMIKLCRRKKIDLILCKSISRFARNTVDCLDTVRELKALGINVKFEKENIETLSATSEFTISLYASFAQAESESISKNVTWGIEKAFQEGKVNYVLHQTLGYRPGEDGKPVIVEDEAEHVRTIFRMFADGYSMRDIADRMNELKVKRRNGSSYWCRNNVNAILINEKYVGDAVLQKSYTVDCLTHERVKNTGQKPQYYIRDCHDAIIDRETWDKVRLELARRSAETAAKLGAKKSKKKPQENVYHTKYCLNELLRCPYCGSTFHRTIWKSKGVGVGVWRCGKRMEFGKKKCPNSPSIHEEKLHRAIVNAVNSIVADRDNLNNTVIEVLGSKKTALEENRTERARINSRLGEIDQKRSEILALVNRESFERFRDELRAINDEETELREKAKVLEKESEVLQRTIKEVTGARELYASMEPLTGFEDRVIRRLIERIDVIGKTKVRVIFKGGLETDAAVEK